MASHAIRYITVLSRFLAAKSFDKAATQSIELFFFFCFIWIIHFSFHSVESAPGTYVMSSVMTGGSILLFLFVPASNIYLRDRFRQQPLMPIHWSFLGRSLLNISNLIGYRGVRKSMLLTKKKVENEFHRSGFLSKEQASQIQARVAQHFEENKPYLLPGYSLQMLSDETDFSVHHLSAFINGYYKMNFNNFINEHRVIICIEKFLQKEWRLKKLEAIAQDCGFNNRNTFTSAFKKTTGLNPSEFLRRVKLNDFKNSNRHVDRQTADFDEGSTTPALTADTFLHSIRKSG